MGFWSIVVPEGTTNYIENPSFESNITDDWTNWSNGAAAGTRVQASDVSRYGAYSVLLTKTGGAQADDWGMYATLPTSTNGQDYIASAYVWVPGGATATLLLQKSAGVGILQTESVTQTITTGWVRIETAALTANATGDGMFVFIYIDGTATVAAYFDAVQCERLDHVTTYCDGTQEGCEWNGTAHASTSTRSALSRAGGRVYDITDEYGFYVTRHFDSGVAPLTQHLDEYAIIPGGEVSSYKVHPRVLTLVGHMQSRAGYATLHAQIQGLLDIVKPDAVPGNQPVRLRYTEATVTKEIAAHYEGGLEGNWDARRCAEQNPSIRFLCADPFWYEVEESGAVLDTNDTATLRYLAGRLRSTGQWSALGLTANPTADGVLQDVLVAKQSDGSVYFGGLFDGINNNVPVGGDNIIRYDPQDGSWNLLVGAGDVPDPGTGSCVHVISEGPDGRIYIGGAFTAVNGVGTADYIVGYNPSTDAWFSLSDPDNGGLMDTVYAMAWDSLGNLYVGGSFTGVDAVANTAYFAKWDGTSWTAVGGGGGTGTVRAIAIDSSDNIYIGGGFLNWDADGDADYWAWYSSSAAAWAAVDDIALGASVSTMEVDNAGNIYVGGSFVDADSNANADRIFKWTGTAVEALGTGMDDAVNRIHIAPDSTVWATGQFTVAGSVTSLNGIARWNGAAWLPPDVDLSGAPSIVYGIAFGKPDPVVGTIYDVYLAFTSTGACYFSGTATVTNGTAEAYPQIVVKRSGGTSARIVQVRNENTGKTLYFAYDLLDGETLTIDLDPKAKTIVSSFFGNRRDAMLAGSDWGSFALKPGSNQITAFISVVGAPTITATMVYRDKYWSID